jgi:hypothetical protein
MARTLLPVLLSGDLSLADRLVDTVEVMLKKGTYTLKGPLEELDRLIGFGDIHSARAYLELLKTAFAADISYNQSLHLTYGLPKAVHDLPPMKRWWQIEQLGQVVATDVRLVDSFLDGLARGLQRLNRKGLKRFVAAGLRFGDPDTDSTRKFFALVSGRARRLFEQLQVAVSFHDAAAQLNRYLQARLGQTVNLRPISALTQANQTDPEALVVSDGRSIYLADEIDRYPSRAENLRLYKCLVRFEAGLLEFDTFDFDLDLWLDRYHPEKPKPLENDPESTPASDLQRFFYLFEMPELAADLFTIFEQGRIRILMSRLYPGIVRQHLPMLQSAFLQDQRPEFTQNPLQQLYAQVALGLSETRSAESNPTCAAILQQFRRAVGPGAAVEDSAELTYIFYGSFNKSGPGKLCLKPVFGRRIHAALFEVAQRAEQERISAIHRHLSKAGHHVYRSAIRKHLAPDRQLTPDDVQAMIRHSHRKMGSDGGQRREHQVPVDAAMPLMATLVQMNAVDVCPTGPDGSYADASWYMEWDFRLADYLKDHTRVIDREVAGQENDFYRRILEKYWGLVSQIRRSFELLKPQGLKIFRQWTEGDEFDYRALVDFAVDRKTGRTPSDRLYIKRIKAERSVAVLFLVDLSRSTANVIGGSRTSVLDVEKEALVLMAEALEVIGDAYAIAGFSSNGRLGVDYFHIKDFGDPCGERVRNRIDAMAPQRNTRTGAAIRHAAAQLEGVDSRVRLLIILSDGFPNDVDYKKQYAVADTRRAVSEMAARQIHVHAISVNMNLDGIRVLDDLYGDIHHSLISNVIELPHKLLRIYSALTR